MRKLKWEKLGLIFNPHEHKQISDCISFAQSPQTLVLDDRVRIYYSTRQTDSGKFLSHISYVDFDYSFTRILNLANREVVALGKLGTFDEHGIFPINILKDEDRIVGYTCGWSRRSSVSVETSIGIVISSDEGTTFQKIADGPIMSSNLNEPFLVGDAFVLKLEKDYHMWYIFGKHWLKNEIEEPARVYKIAYAHSVDGINWERDSKCIIQDVLNEYECQALPTVAYHDGIYHMFFCYREAIGFRTDKGKGYRLGYAYSTDLITWTRDDEMGGMQLAEDGWDSEMQCYPHLFRLDTQLYLLYNGNQFGKNGFGLAKLCS